MASRFTRLNLHISPGGRQPGIVVLALVSRAADVDRVIPPERRVIAPAVLGRKRYAVRIVADRTGIGAGNRSVNRCGARSRSTKRRAKGHLAISFDVEPVGVCKGNDKVDNFHGDPGTLQLFQRFCVQTCQGISFHQGRLQNSRVYFL